MPSLSGADARTHLVQALAKLPPGGPEPRSLILAVSGGPDSLALLLLAAENRDHLRAAGFTLSVATVDHGLRAASRNEAAFVARLAADRGLSHRTLRWEGAKPTGNISAEARNARYRLLADHAAAAGAIAVLTAHHQDDQIETHHLAARRHAGDRGLAGMRVSRALAPGLRLVRPFLGVPGAALKALVAQRGILAVNDPTNLDPRYDRARIRSALHLTPGERRDVLGRIADHAMRRDTEDAALGRAVAAFRRDGALAVDDCGTARLARQALRSMEPVLADLLLSRLLRAAGGAEYPPPRLAVRRLAERLRAAPLAGATLGGATMRGDRTLTFHREYGRNGIEERFRKGAGPVIFDRRMRVAVPAPVGDRGRWVLAAFGRTGCGNAVEKTLPVVLDEAGRVVASHPRLLRKLRETVHPLEVSEEVSFRLLADLPSETET